MNYSTTQLGYLGKTAFLNSKKNFYFFTDSNKKLLRKMAKVKPEEVSTPTHFEYFLSLPLHLVHIEDIQSNENNFVVPKLCEDPVIKNIFNVIEKNITDTSNNSIGTSDSSEFCLKLPVKNFKNNVKDEAVLCDYQVVTRDNKNNNYESMNEMKRSNLYLNLKNNLNESKRQSTPQIMAPSFDIKNVEEENNIILPRRKNILPLQSTDSTEATPPDTPVFTSEFKSTRNLDLSKQEAAYDAIVAHNKQDPISSPFHKTQEVTVADQMMTRQNDALLKNKFFSSYDNQDDTKGQTEEIQQALKQLDDVLDEQIPIEVFSIPNDNLSVISKRSSVENIERINTYKEPENCKKSVKELAEMLDSKPLPLQRKDPYSVATTSIEAESKVSIQAMKPSLIGISIFSPVIGKSITEIIAQKREQKEEVGNQKAALKRNFMIPSKIQTLSKSESQDMYCSSNGNQTSSSSQLRKNKFDFQKNFAEVNKILKDPERVRTEMTNTKSNTSSTESSQKIFTSEAEMVNFQKVSWLANSPGKKQKQNQVPQNLHIYENLNHPDRCSQISKHMSIEEANRRNGNVNATMEKIIQKQQFESDYDPSVSESTESAVQKYSCKLNEKENQKRVMNMEENSSDSTLTAATILSHKTDDSDVDNVKWRTDYVITPQNFDISVEDEKNLQLPPVLRTPPNRGISSQRIVQRSTSMYTSGSEEINNKTMQSTSTSEQGNQLGILNRHLSMSAVKMSNDNAYTSMIPPKPAPRRIDFLEQTRKNFNLSQEDVKNFKRNAKRPVPLPRQSKLKTSFNDNLLLKTSSTLGAKIQQGSINGSESMVAL
ncbi:unnamed protein product [Thelazia callipaeda]|uniref:WH2 domain-containing protein n=1 Tax=Thelazia callipaeda TaxID=103827 RepID=A0A0N5CV05_THECL|nr:unnamed protein product [Thelazia callipaeda]